MVDWDMTKQFGPRDHAELIQMDNRLVEIAKLPMEQRQERFDELEKEMPGQPPAVRLLMPAVSKLAEADRRRVAMLRCATVLIACERYRLAHGRWPTALAELTPAFLKAVPLDPFDGKPLRLAVWDEGLVIYSIGKDAVAIH